MNYKNMGYNRLLVADLYHWELDQTGNFSVKENFQRLRSQGKV